MDCIRDDFIGGVLLNGRYETVRPLNHGSFGMVFLAKDLISCHEVALKCLTKPNSPQDAASVFAVDERSEELKIHARIGRHRNIVNLLDSFETDSHIFLVLEYCSMGDLYEAIRLEKGPRETEHVREFMLQLVHAVEFLHVRGIYHRDLKPENIFMTSSRTLKLGDFGLATTETWSYETSVGSDRYMAPEQYDCTENGLSPAKADIWSIGICLLNILFSRNPFAVPADSDPLFADFSRDRQSLFDVFPNMSQDTFEVLNHCLIIDPNKRSLSLLKEALYRAVSFTTDDEALDEFCTENREVVASTANREPLRTPSVSSPSGDYFPWAKALQMSPRPPARQLSHVSEDLFPGSEISTHDWLSKADSRSIESNVDSGLGISLASTNSAIARSKPVAISGSFPLMGSRAGSALSSFFGKKKQLESKSWSDIWDEEEEEREEIVRASLPKRSLLGTVISQDDSEDEGRSTPRAGLTQLNHNGVNTRNSSPSSTSSKDDQISEQTGFIFEDHSISAPRYSSPRRAIMDKWAALGDRRRATTPKKEVAATMPDPIINRGNWRRNFMNTTKQTKKTNDFTIWRQKEWNISQDWRRNDQHLPGRSPPPSQLDGGLDFYFESDVEWVGGSNDLHL